MRACLFALPPCHFLPPSLSREPGTGLPACSALSGSISGSRAQLACQPGYLCPAEATSNGPAVPGPLGISASWSRVTPRQLPRHVQKDFGSDRWGSILLGYKGLGESVGGILGNEDAHHGGTGPALAMGHGRNHHGKLAVIHRPRGWDCAVCFVHIISLTVWQQCDLSMLHREKLRNREGEGAWPRSHS